MSFWLYTDDVIKAAGGADLTSSLNISRCDACSSRVDLFKFIWSRNCCSSDVNETSFLEHWKVTKKQIIY